MTGNFTMSDTAAILIVLGIAGLIGLMLYWLLITTEGVYLGQRVVIWLYDLYARRYDSIKQFEPDWEQATLAEPITRILSEIDVPLVLDVATGTGRLQRALLRWPEFRGQIVGLDLSRRMLAEALRSFSEPANALPADAVERAPLIHAPADALPFADESFDAVTCLEVLEFMPHPDRVIAEMVRVLRPGGVLVITNRKGLDARLMPFKTRSVNGIVDHLRRVHHLEDVSIQVWQYDYDLLRAFRPGPYIDPPDQHTAILPLAGLRCPVCGLVGFALPPASSPQTPITGLRCQHTIHRGLDGVIELY